MVHCLKEELNVFAFGTLSIFLELDVHTDEDRQRLSRQRRRQAFVWSVISCKESLQAAIVDHLQALEPLVKAAIVKISKMSKVVVKREPSDFHAVFHRVLQPLIKLSDPESSRRQDVYVFCDIDNVFDEVVIGVLNDDGCVVRMPA